VSGGNGRDEPLPEGAQADPPEEASPDVSGGLAPVEGGPVAPLTREQIEALRRERDELKDELLHRRADFENYRKRVERDRQAAAFEAEASLLRQLVPTLDNLERALAAATQDSPLRHGVELIRRELVALMESRGVAVEEPVGQAFDPELHQALSHEQTSDAADGSVLEVLGKGYRFRDRLLRPALVKVAKGRDDDGGSELD
jgi:molecular chaperone GrpE